MDYKYRLTIYKTNDRAHKKLIINSGDTIRKDPFFYKSASKSIDVDYIENIFNAKK